MSIFGIILLALVAAFFLVMIAWVVISMVTEFDVPDWLGVTAVIVGIALWIAFIFTGIGINTEDHKLWVAKYEAEKYTIEASLESETLSGLERIELVNKAAELNGNLAYRKEAIKLWHHVVYGDKSIYDSVEPIQIK